MKDTRRTGGAKCETVNYARFLRRNRRLPMAVPYPFIVGKAKITVHAQMPRIYEALLNPQDLAVWWGPDAFVDPQLDGRYETNPPEGRQEGVIIGLDAPRRIAFTWPMAIGDASVDTSVSYELFPKGPETDVVVIHRARTQLPHDYNATWKRALDALRAHIESGESAAPETGSDQSVE